MSRSGPRAASGVRLLVPRRLELGTRLLQSPNRGALTCGSSPPVSPPLWPSAIRPTASRLKLFGLAGKLKLTRRSS
jgi:hypothetical protein